MGAVKTLELLVLEATSQADRNSEAYDNLSAEGLLIRVELSATAGTVAYTPKLQRRGADGTWEDVWSATAALAADGVAWYWISPEAEAADGEITEAVQIPIPEAWRFTLVATTADGSNNASTEAEADVYL